MSLSVYERDVKEASRKNLDKRFPNSSIAHAKLLIQEIINNANEEIWLLSSNFNLSFYTSIKENIEKFLANPKHKLNVIVASNENSLLKELVKNYPNQFTIKQVRKDQLPKDKDSQEYVNYIVNDTNAYRYEYSEKDIEQGIVEAIANFNSPNEASYLKENFQSILNMAA